MIVAPVGLPDRADPRISKSEIAMLVYLGKYQDHSVYRNVTIRIRTQGATVSKYLIDKRGAFATIKATKAKIDLLWSQYPSQMASHYPPSIKQ